MKWYRWKIVLFSECWRLFSRWRQQINSTTNSTTNSTHLSVCFSLFLTRMNTFETKLALFTNLFQNSRLDPNSLSQLCAISAFNSCKEAGFTSKTQDFFKERYVFWKQLFSSNGVEENEVPDLAAKSAFADCEIQTVVLSHDVDGHPTSVADVHATIPATTSATTDPNPLPTSPSTSPSNPSATPASNPAATPTKKAHKIKDPVWRPTKVVTDKNGKSIVVPLDSRLKGYYLGASHASMESCMYYTRRGVWYFVFMIVFSIFRLIINLFHSSQRWGRKWCQI